MKKQQKKQTGIKVEIDAMARHQSCGSAPVAAACGQQNPHFHRTLSNFLQPSPPSLCLSTPSTPIFLQKFMLLLHVSINLTQTLFR
ncbi:hypothetical protein EPI10_028942 [Gossypium australe]|uniref:Uncharacterized protein n=1 Tax=Gossypium australe TaxID=47621 RepID=A0A5B6UZ30_9ROSI|nr:hypothetical protein EPI10_028942 [Gossypium australe]